MSFLLISFFATAVYAVDLPQYLNFDGQLTDDVSNNPITTTTPVTFRILDPTGGCILYEESRSITPDTSGHFSVKVGPAGGGTRNTSADGGLLWKNIFQNDVQVRAHDPANCVGGYTPAVGDARKLRVIVNSVTLSPDFSLAPVPYATVAESLQGKSAADFLSTAGNANLNGYLRFSNYNEARFSDASANYVGFKAPVGLSTSTVWSLPNLDGTNGQVLQTNGAGQLNWVTPASSGIMTLNGLGGSAQTFNTGAGGSSPNWSSSGAIHTLNIPSANSVGTTAGLLSYADWTNFNSKQNALGYTPLNSAGGTMSGVLTMTANLDMSSNRILNLANPTGAQDAATKSYVDSMGGMCVLKAGDSMTGALSVSSLGSPTVPSINVNGHGLFSPGATSLGFGVAGAERMRIDSGGFVGIGTSTPTQRLTVEGSASPQIKLNSTDGSGSAMKIYLGGIEKASIAANSGDTYVDSYGGNTLHLRADGSINQMVLVPGGNIGINTNTPAATLDVNGTVRIGNMGPPIQSVRNFANVTCSYTPAPPISANSTASCTFTLGGSGISGADNMAVSCSPQGPPSLPMVHSCYVSAFEQVTLGIHNIGGAGMTPPSSWNITIIKF